MNRDLDQSGCRRLVCAVALRALKDSRSGDGEAREWWSGEAVHWLTAIDLDVDEVDLTRALIADE
jgi:hypothetical protein